MIQKVLLVWTNVFSARAQNKNTDEEAFRKCAEPYSRRSNTLRRSFRRTETKSGVVSGESQKMSAEGAMHSCCAESLRQKDRVKKDTEEKQPRNKKSGAQKRKNSGSAVFCCIFQSEPCSAGKIPQEMVFFFSKRCGCVIHIVQTIRRMEREKRKWMH